MGEADIKNGSFWKSSACPEYSRELIYDKAAKIPEVREQLDLGKSLEEIAKEYPSLTGTVESYYQTEPVKVYKYKDFYINADSGRHRTVAGQAMNVEIPVEIIGEIIN